jgi:hypothetical protein
MVAEIGLLKVNENAGATSAFDSAAAYSLAPGWILMDSYQHLGKAE